MSKPVQQALAECRQAIADVGTRPLSGPEHARLKRQHERTQKLAAELRAQLDEAHDRIRELEEILNRLGPA